MPDRAERPWVRNPAQGSGITPGTELRPGLPAGKLSEGEPARWPDRRSRPPMCPAQNSRGSTRQPAHSGGRRRNQLRGGSEAVRRLWIQRAGTFNNLAVNGFHSSNYSRIRIRAGWATALAVPALWSSAASEKISEAFSLQQGGSKCSGVGRFYENFHNPTVDNQSSPRGDG